MMMTPEHRPAQRQFVHQHINWDRVAARLTRYPAISRNFPLEVLEKRREKSPYYCHYMAWRLGVWSNEDRFQRLEELLCCAEKLPNWQHEKSLLSSPEFADFWSLFWQLQVAEHLCNVGTDVRWGKSGPDLSVGIDGKRWYIECYVLRKSFGLIEFLSELLQQIDPSIRVMYDPCLPFQLPQNEEGERVKPAQWCDAILSPFLNPAYLARKKEKARLVSPVEIYQQTNGKLHVVLEGEGEYQASDNAMGDPQFSLEKFLAEAVNAKQCSNNLKNCHPNILAASYLLSIAVQITSIAAIHSDSTILPKIGPNIDVFAMARPGFGIDGQLSKETLGVMKISKSQAADRKSLSQIADILSAEIE